MTELMLRNPISVLSKNLKADVSEFANIPKDQLYVSRIIARYKSCRN